MGASTLLTLLGLLIAAYAVLPPERRLDLKLRLKPLDWIIAATAVVLIHYIQFYPILLSLRLAPDFGPWRWGLNAENASYLVVLIAAGFVLLRARFAKVRPSTISTLRNLVERLTFEERFSEVLFLLERHLSALFRVYNQEYILPRLRKRLMPEPWLLFTGSEGASNRVRTFAARLIPSYEKPQVIAMDTARRVLVYEPFVVYLAKARPYFGIQILDYEFFGSDPVIH